MPSPYNRPPFRRFAKPEEKVDHEIAMFLERLSGISAAIIILILALAAASSVPVACGPYIVLIILAIIFRKNIHHAFGRERISEEFREDE